MCFDRDLRRAEHVTGGMKRHVYPVDPDRLAVASRLRGLCEILAKAQAHEVEGFRRGQHGAVAGPRVVGARVGDERARDRRRRVDMKSAGFAVQPGRRGCEKLVRAHAFAYV